MKMRRFAVIALAALSVSQGQVRNSGKNPAAQWPMCITATSAARAFQVTDPGNNPRGYVAIVAGGASALDDPEPPAREALVVFPLP